jgi:hypothetical protein
MRLDICMFCRKELTEAVACKVLDLVMELASAIVALARIPLGIFIAHN